MPDVTPMGHVLDALKSPHDPKDDVYSPPNKALGLAPPPLHAHIKGITHVPVLSQLRLGACTGNAWAAAFAAAMPSYLALSRLFIYYNERLLEGTVGQDSGAFVRDGGAVLLHQGCPEESLEPYNIEDFTIPPTAEEYAAALEHRIKAYYRQRTLSDVRRAIAVNHPVVIGHSVTDAFERVGSDGRVPDPQAGDVSLGGHCTFLWGYDYIGGGRYTYDGRNSWDKTWGDAGNYHVTDYWLGNQSVVFDMFSLSLG